MKLWKEIKLHLHRELIRRQLVKYFQEDKKFGDNFEKPVYPPAIADLPKMVYTLHDKVEIRPFVESVDPMLGMVRLGWNLFVLGINRMYLGETYHNDSTQLKQSLMSGSIPEGARAELVRNPREIIKFIDKILSGNIGDLTYLPTRLEVEKAGLKTNQGMGAISSPGGFYSKPANYAR